jgi:hypothetical protein
MADYTRDKTAVVPSANAIYLLPVQVTVGVVSFGSLGNNTQGPSTKGQLYAGEAIDAGQPVRRDATDPNKLLLVDANAADPANLCDGVAVNSAAINQPIEAITDDPNFTHGYSTVAAGHIVICSSNKGEVCESAGRTSGWKTTVVMVGYSATQAVLKIIHSTVAVP